MSSDSKWKTSIVCTECEYRRETTEENPTLMSRCPQCEGVGTLEYEDKETCKVCDDPFPEEYEKFDDDAPVYADDFVVHLGCVDDLFEDVTAEIAIEPDSEPNWPGDGPDS